MRLPGPLPCSARPRARLSFSLARPHRATRASRVSPSPRRALLALNASSHASALLCAARVPLAPLVFAHCVAVLLAPRLAALRASRLALPSPRLAPRAPLASPFPRRALLALHASSHASVLLCVARASRLSRSLAASLCAALRPRARLAPRPPRAALSSHSSRLPTPLPCVAPRACVSLSLARSLRRGHARVSRLALLAPAPSSH
jgi:hypothetical protein